jgi:hypothetical protein
MSTHLARLLASAAAQPPRPVRVDIERVTLIGVPLTPAQSRQLGAELTHELQRLARAPGWPADAAGAVLPGVIARAVTVPADGRPATLGRAVARSVFDAVRSAR